MTSVLKLENLSKLMEIDYGKSVILMASRPSLWKGHLCLIKSLKKINTEFQCILIGANDGKISFKKKLYKLIENLGLGDKVRLTPSSNDIQAALGISQLKNVNKWINYRNHLAQNYFKKLIEELIILL